MKKILSVVLVLCLVLASCASAYATVAYTSGIAKGNGYTTSGVVKSSGIGVNASVSILQNPGSHSIYYQVRKSSGYACTPSKNSSASSGSISLAYNLDGYGESLGRTGYSYNLRIAHRSQCTVCTSTKVIVGVDWAP